MALFKREMNPWHKSARGIKFNNRILEAELRTSQGWKYNRLEIHPLLLNKPLINDNGLFKYVLSKEEDDMIMNKLYPLYRGPTLPYIRIKKCVILSVDLPKYNHIREGTLDILKSYRLPPVEVHYGYTPETLKNSRFYDCLANLNQRNYFTCGMLEVFEDFIQDGGDEWLLYFEDDVRPINVNEDLTKLYNVPADAELIRPYIGKNEPCRLSDITYRVSSDGGNNHAIYLSVSACKKIVHYAKKYKWKYICDIDIYKLAKNGGLFPTGYDGWSLAACNGNNDITGNLSEDEKINMYQMSHCIFNQTSNPCA